MIRSLKYSKGVVKKSVFSLSVGDRIWIDVTNPTPLELKRISKLTGIYVDDLNRTLDKDALPRVTNRKSYSIVVLRSLTQKRNYAPFGLFVNNKFIVTVHKKKVYSIDDLFSLLSGKEGKEFFSNGLTYIFFRIASYVNKKFHSELDKLEDEFDILEDNILDGKVSDPSQIYNLKGTVMSIRRALTSNRNLVDLISGGYSRHISAKNQNWLSELKIETDQVVAVTELLRERLTSAMEMYMSSVSNKLNDIMKGFTVIASLLLLPMLISGIWGMNFAKIPFFDNSLGFYIPLLIMLVSVTLMGIWFKSKKWM